MDLVQSQGKLNKKVTTLLTPEMVAAMQALLDTRVQCGVNTTNVFIFANSAKGHLNPWQVLNAMAKRAGCKQPALISSTRLRKYLATVTQVGI